MHWHRLRRLRGSARLRDLVAESDLSVSHLVFPVFVQEGISKPVEIEAMPGQWRYPVEEVGRVVEACLEVGVPAILLFGIPERKDEQASAAWSEESVVVRAVSLIRERYPEVVVITDVCVCSYMPHGHCGVLDGRGNVDNDRTNSILARMAVAHARAGAHMVAPSAMMDHQVRVIREALDAAGFTGTGILSYSAKYRSNFYGPFREAAHSAPLFGDRSTYQMDFRNWREALREVELDVEEGADAVMVKPALAYLDVIRAVSEHFTVPVFAYNVSGEYAMVKAAAARGWLEEREVVLEILTAIRRAGATAIITYHALEVARWLRGGWGGR